MVMITPYRVYCVMASSPPHPALCGDDHTIQDCVVIITTHPGLVVITTPCIVCHHHTMQHCVIMTHTLYCVPSSPHTLHCVVMMTTHPAHHHHTLQGVCDDHTPHPVVVWHTIHVVVMTTTPCIVC